MLARSSGNMRERHRGRRTRDAWQIVVLCHPVAPIPESLDMAREVERVAQRLTGIAALGDRERGRERKTGSSGGSIRQFMSNGGYSRNTLAAVTRMCCVTVRGGSVSPASRRRASGSTS